MANTVTTSSQFYSIAVTVRFVPNDQWLTTHLSSTWKIADVKLWLLSKFLPSVYSQVTTLSKGPRLPKKRTVSPIRFATPQEVKTKARFGPNKDAYYQEDDYDEDEDDLDDDLYEKFKYNAASRQSTSSAIPPNSSETPSTSGKSSSIDVSSYGLVSFSTGQFLEDFAPLGTYGIQNHQLLELYVLPFVVNLPRAFPDHYIRPYFEARVWALRAVIKEPDRWTDDLASRLSDGEDKGKGRERRRQTRLEWRERWVFIQEGVFRMCRSRNDPKPAHEHQISNMKALRGAEHLRSETTSALVYLKFPISSATKPQRSRTVYSEVSRASQAVDNTKTILCCKFRTIKQIKSKTSGNLQDSQTPSNGGWWRRGSKDGNAPSGTGGNDGRKGSKEAVDDSRRFGKTESIGSYDDDINEGIWVVLDMLDETAFKSIIRTFHREASPNILTTFLSTRSAPSSIHPFSSSSITTQDTRSPSPISFVTLTNLGSRPPSPALPPPPADLVAATKTEAKTPQSSPPRSPVTMKTTFSGTLPPAVPKVNYLEWRISAFRRARKTGLGDVGRAMEWAMYGFPTSKSDEDDGLAKPKPKPRRGRPSIPHRLSAAGLEDLMSQSSALVESDDSDEQSMSEVEWDGWEEEIRKKRRKAKEASLNEEKKKKRDIKGKKVDRSLDSRDSKESVVQWESNWSINGATIGTTISDQSVPPSSFKFGSPPKPAGSPPLPVAPINSPRTIIHYASEDSLQPERGVSRHKSQRSLGEKSSLLRPKSPLSEELDEPLDEDEEDEYQQEEETFPGDGVGGDEVDGFDAGDVSSTCYYNSQFVYSHSPQMLAHEISSGSFTRPNSSGSSSMAPRSMAMTSITSTVSVGPQPPSLNTSPRKGKKINSALNMLKSGSNPTDDRGSNIKGFNPAVVKKKSSKEKDDEKDKGKGKEVPGKQQEQAYPPPQRGIFGPKLKLSISLNSSSRNSHQDPDRGNISNRPNRAGPMAAMALAAGAAMPTTVTSSSLAVETPLSPKSAVSSNSPFESPHFARPDDSDY